jgi:hypothetical protein
VPSSVIADPINRLRKFLGLVWFPFRRVCARTWCRGPPCTSPWAWAPTRIQHFPEHNIVNYTVSGSVPAPDPYVLGLLDPYPDLSFICKENPSDSWFFHQQAKNEENLVWLLYDFLSVKNDVNVPSKHKSERKNCFFCILKVTDQKSRICQSKVQIRGSGSVPKCHGSGTLVSGVPDFRSKLLTVSVRDPGYCWITVEFLKIYFCIIYNYFELLTSWLSSREKKEFFLNNYPI